MRQTNCGRPTSLGANMCPRWDLANMIHVGGQGVKVGGSWLRLVCDMSHTDPFNKAVMYASVLPVLFLFTSWDSAGSQASVHFLHRIFTAAHRNNDTWLQERKKAWNCLTRAWMTMRPIFQTSSTTYKRYAAYCLGMLESPASCFLSRTIMNLELNWHNSKVMACSTSFSITYVTFVVLHSSDTKPFSTTSCYFITFLFHDSFVLELMEDTSLSERPLLNSRKKLIVHVVLMLLPFPIEYLISHSSLKNGFYHPLCSLSDYVASHRLWSHHWNTHNCPYTQLHCWETGVEQILTSYEAINHIHVLLQSCNLKTNMA